MGVKNDVTEHWETKLMTDLTRVIRATGTNNDEPHGPGGRRGHCLHFLSSHRQSGQLTQPRSRHDSDEGCAGDETARQGFRPQPACVNNDVNPCLTKIDHGAGEARPRCSHEKGLSEVPVPAE